MAHANPYAGETIVADHFTAIMNRVNKLESITYGFSDGRGWNRSIGDAVEDFNGVGTRYALSYWDNRLYVSMRRPTTGYPESTYTGVKVFDLDGNATGQFLDGRPVVHLAWREPDIPGMPECTFRIPDHFWPTPREWSSGPFSIRVPNAGYHFETRKRDGDFVRYFGEHHIYEHGEAWDERITNSREGCWIDNMYHAIVSTDRKNAGGTGIAAYHWWVYVWDADGEFVERYSLHNGQDKYVSDSTLFDYTNSCKDGFLYRVTVGGSVTEEYPVLVIASGNDSFDACAAWVCVGTIVNGQKTAQLYKWLKPYWQNWAVSGSGVACFMPSVVPYTVYGNDETVTSTAMIAVPFNTDMWKYNEREPPPPSQKFSQVFFYDFQDRIQAGLPEYRGGVGWKTNGAYPGVVNVSDSGFPAFSDALIVGNDIYALTRGYSVRDGSGGTLTFYLSKRSRAALTTWNGYTAETMTEIGTFPSPESFRPYVEPLFMRRWKIPRQHLTDIRAALIRLLQEDGANGTFMFFHPTRLTYLTNPSLWDRRIKWDPEGITDHWYKYFAMTAKIPADVGYSRKAFMDYWPITEEQIEHTPELIEDWAKDDDELAGTRCDDMDIGELHSMSKYMEESSRVFGA